jgi:small subunit ribosomal protein S20
MPNTQSAKKALRQTQRRRTTNLQRKDSLKKAVKSFKKLVAEKKQDEAKAALSTLFKTADKIAKSKYIKKNKASRIKSRAAKTLRTTFEKKEA